MTRRKGITKRIAGRLGVALLPELDPLFIILSRFFDFSRVNQLKLTFSQSQKPDRKAGRCAAAGAWPRLRARRSTCACRRSRPSLPLPPATRGPTTTSVSATALFRHKAASPPAESSRIRTTTVLFRHPIRRYPPRLPAATHSFARFVIIRLPEALARAGARNPRRAAASSPAVAYRAVAVLGHRLQADRPRAQPGSIAHSRRGGFGSSF